MSWGAASGGFPFLQVLMPYWLFLLTAVCKPLVTIFVLGPPRIVIERETFSRLTDPESPVETGDAQASGWNGKEEVFPLLFMLLFIFTLVHDALGVYEEASTPNNPWSRKVSGVLARLSVSPNIASMYNAVCLAGLYLKIIDNESEIDDLMFGEAPQWFENSRQAVKDFAEKFEPGSLLRNLCFLLPLVFMIFPMFFVRSIFLGWRVPVPHVALALMESRIQRVYIQAIWYTYKPLFHMLLAVTIAGLFAYIWITGLIFATTYMIVRLIVNGGLLARIVRVRSCMGASVEHIQAAISHTEEFERAWIDYLLGPPVNAILLPVCMLLTVRLCAGVPYLEALQQTWSDRCVTAYFGALVSKASNWWDRTDWVIAFLSQLL